MAQAASATGDRVTLSDLRAALPGLDRQAVAALAVGETRKGAISAIHARLAELADGFEIATCTAHPGLDEGAAGDLHCPECLDAYDATAPAWASVRDRRARALRDARRAEAVADPRPLPIVQVIQRGNVRIDGRLVMLSAPDEVSGYTAAYLLKYHPGLVELIAGV